ncbi:MAG TPA: hypothetical protein VGB27_04050, partial [Candidatus Binatia bacterium]
MIGQHLTASLFESGKSLGSVLVSVVKLFAAMAIDCNLSRSLAPVLTSGALPSVQPLTGCHLTLPITRRGQNAAPPGQPKP